MRRALQSLVGLGGITALGALAWWLVVILIDWLQSMDTDTRAATIAVLGVVSVPLMTLGTQLWVEKRKSHEAAIREQRREFYSEVVSTLMQLFESGRTTAGQAATAEVVARLQALVPQMVLFGSKDFLRAWHQFRASPGHVAAGRASPHDATLIQMAALESVLLAARKDLGQQSGQNARGFIMTTFINDVAPADIQRAYKRLQVMGSVLNARGAGPQG
ncbi:hypothetical protein USB125703_01377 [Pseudoclavibacter triregionum]|nr:hypothetical protein USB125703_01377 [Pseudoclavibacter triregionum]